MNKQSYINQYVILGIVSMLLLPGCDWFDSFKEKAGSKPSMTMPGVESSKQQANQSAIACAVDDGSKALVTFNGVPVVTEKSFASIKKDLMESTPQFKETVAMMGGEDQCDKYILEGLARTALLNQVVSDKKLDQDPEYVKEYDRAVRNIKDVLNARCFAKGLQAHVPDSELRAYYDKNKDLLPVLKQSTGGIKASGVMFDSEKAAQDFLVKAKEAKGDLKKVAKDAQIADDKIQDFGLVHERSMGINPVVKEKIMLISKFPTTDLIKVDDKTYWVVNAASKEAPKYAPFDQVKEHLKKYLEQEKLGEAFEKEIEALKQQYDVKIMGGQPEEESMIEKIKEQPTKAQPMKELKPKEATKPAAKVPAKPTNVPKAA